jgi:MtfA peptidase
MFGALRNWRRRRALPRVRIERALWDEAVMELPVLGRLDAASAERLHELASLFLHEKRFEPADGLELEERMRVRIATLACLPVLELGLDCYDGFVAVIVYPGEFIVRDREEVDEDGVVHVGDDVLSGEAWEQGPVILAWDEVDASGRGTGFNVVAHEFAHKLDYLDGAMNGLPLLHADMSVSRWNAVFQAAYDELCASVERGEDPWLDPYAAENPAEFFAVCSELFFDLPEDLAAEHPDVYAQLAAYYRQDPAAAAQVPGLADSVILPDGRGGER